MPHKAEPTRKWTFEMQEHQAELVHRLADNSSQTLKNHIASAVERNDLEGAKKLVAELREVQAIFAGFNVDAVRGYTRDDEELPTMRRVKLASERF